MMQELIGNAIRATSMSTITDLLHDIAERTDSYGCILWRVAPPQGGSDEERLFVMANWFSDDRICANHALPMASSRTGQAIQLGMQHLITDMQNVPDPDHFLRDAGITMFCSTPIMFADGVKGAVNVYRREEIVYDHAALAEAEQRAQMIPLLFQVIEDEVSFRLITTLDGLLAGVRHSIPATVSPLEHVKPAMNEVCKAVADALNCVEASIFLEDRFEAQGEYRLAGTTWNELVGKRSSYNASEEGGVTGWSLAHPETHVIIFHLPDEKAIVRTYKNMKWLDSLDLKTSLGGHPRIKDLKRLPPLSYMSAPVLDDAKDVVGILRCSVGLGPVYFDQRQHAILERIASRIGPFWSGFLRNRALEALVASVSSLNSFAHTELMKDKPEEDRILKEALRITRSVVPGAEITDVRLLNDKKTELRFAVQFGEAWEKGTVEERELRKNRVYSVEERPTKSAGAHVIQTGETYVVQDTKNDPYYLENFALTKRMIVAPLALGPGEIYGTLDIRTSVDRDFPEFALRMSELLASQLALYRKLAILVRDLNETVRDLTDLRDRQTQINEDLAHQLKSPTMTAHRRVSDLLRGMPDSELKTQLLRIRGVCARATHVAMNSWLFAKLARKEPITANKMPMEGADLHNLIRISAFDASYLSRGEQKHTFYVDPGGFSQIQRLEVDRDLLEQALTQLLDNAFKYSVRDEQVIVTGGYTRSSRKGGGDGRVRISVTSEGVRLESSEVSKCIERGWQSEEAQSVSGSGSGIGLWIVHHIMEAHGGKLEIVPTDSSGKTTFSLLFPVQ